MLRKGLIFLVALLLLTGCNLPNRTIASGTPTVDAIATEVSSLLTQMPTSTTTGSSEEPTATATFAASDTPVPATATSTPAQSTQETPQQTATMTPTITAGDPKSALGEPVWRNTLDSAEKFYLYENEGTRVTHENGALVLSGLLSNGWLGWSLTFSHPAQHFYLEAVMNTQTCSGADQYGLVFRAPDTEAGYFYGVTCDGKFFLEARDFSDDSSRTIVDTTANTAIQTGSNAVNRLGVMASGDRLSLYANGVLLGEVNDTTFTDEGNFGAFIAANATPGFTVRMDEIAVWDLPGY
jgi:hypothetical protein